MKRTYSWPPGTIVRAHADDEEDELVRWQRNAATLGVGVFYLLLLKAKIILFCLLVYLFILYVAG
jgi:hypothetical protein